MIFDSSYSTSHIFRNLYDKIVQQAKNIVERPKKVPASTCGGISINLTHILTTLQDILDRPIPTIKEYVSSGIGPAIAYRVTCKKAVEKP